MRNTFSKPSFVPKVISISSVPIYREEDYDIDYIVDAIAAQGKGFLLETIGSRQEGLKQIFSSASEFSSLIIEYVQRFGDFHGFFTKENVAQLTFAAGQEEGVREDV